MESKFSVHLIPVIVGIVIFLGSMITYSQFSSYQDRAVESEKKEIIRVIENLLERREGRIQTIASSLTTFLPII